MHWRTLRASVVVAAVFLASVSAVAQSEPEWEHSATDVRIEVVDGHVVADGERLFPLNEDGTIGHEHIGKVENSRVVKPLYTHLKTSLDDAADSAVLHIRVEAPLSANALRQLIATAHRIGVEQFSVESGDSSQSSFGFRFPVKTEGEAQKETSSGGKLTAVVLFVSGEDAVTLVPPEQKREREQLKGDRLLYNRLVELREEHANTLPVLVRGSNDVSAARLVDVMRLASRRLREPKYDDQESFDRDRARSSKASLFERVSLLSSSQGVTLDLYRNRVTSMWGSSASAVGSGQIHALGSMSGDDYESSKNKGFGGLGLSGSDSKDERSKRLGLANEGTAGRGSGGRGYGKGADDLGAVEGTPKVTVGEPVVTGSLDEKVISDLARENLSEAKSCYESGLEKDKSMAGRVTMTFTVSATGAVIATRVKKSTLRQFVVEKCLASKIRRWTFPEPGGGGIAIVNLPFEFTLEAE